MVMVSPSQRAAVEDQIRSLEQMGIAALRAEWRRLIGGDPPQVSRDLLLRAIAYHVQESAFGGLARSNQKQLREAATRSIPHRDSATALRPGAKLVREWYGRTHVVAVTGSGFDYGGQTFRSLTHIAKLITGAHWSGPRFFGLTDRKRAEELSHG